MLLILIFANLRTSNLTTGGQSLQPAPKIMTLALSSPQMMSNAQRVM